jgi:hypothetical protein
LNSRRNELRPKQTSWRLIGFGGGTETVKPPLGKGDSVSNKG